MMAEKNNMKTPKNKKKEPCQQCGGTGKIDVCSTNGECYKITCPMCKGLGAI